MRCWLGVARVLVIGVGTRCPWKKVPGNAASAAVRCTGSAGVIYTGSQWIHFKFNYMGHLLTSTRGKAFCPPPNPARILGGGGNIPESRQYLGVQFGSCS